MYAGVGGQGAEDAWHHLSAKMGLHDIKGDSYCGGTVDIAKCFDQINRELLKLIALAAGMPTKIVDAYMRFQDDLLVHNTVASGIGIGFKRRCGIPQGCPLSMIFITLMLRPWLLMMSGLGNQAFGLTDDLSLIHI